jgi:hypothetical protein
MVNNFPCPAEETDEMSGTKLEGQLASQAFKNSGHYQSRSIIYSDISSPGSYVGKI